LKSPSVERGEDLSLLGFAFSGLVIFIRSVSGGEKFPGVHSFANGEFVRDDCNAASTR
jgi:hypothetical protein